MTAQHDTHPITVAGLRRDLRLFEIKPGVRIAILNILGDTELVQAASRAAIKIFLCWAMRESGSRLMSAS